MKNALISLHSRKVIEQLYEREDQVILSAYLSKDISAIYIFFKHDTSKEPLVFDKPPIIDPLNCLYQLGSLFINAFSWKRRYIGTFTSW